ncbi:BUD32 family EKC/KEOPS complex subunit [Vallitalea okinawensis]|uniref:hypothetical protein n=1 Tax=Vallitalea okinawensis TaxID=2078660 RepID=UPI000CFD819F|nr:hypothetical protein [Vallitalea okinawensis]
MMTPIERIEKYKSKKNHVYAVEFSSNGEKKRAVLKDFNSIESKQQEIFYLQLLRDHNIKVPKILDQHDQMILLEYLAGELLLERIINLEERQIDPELPMVKEVFNQLLSWLGQFYRITENVLEKKMIFGDVNFRNFIINDHLYGFDFEDCREGSPEEDGGAICAHLLTYYPEYTSWKQKACGVLQSIMIEDFHYEKNRLEKATNYYLDIIKERRSIFKKK